LLEFPSDQRSLALLDDARAMRMSAPLVADNVSSCWDSATGAARLPVSCANRIASNSTFTAQM